MIVVAFNSVQSNYKHVKNILLKLILFYQIGG